MKDYSAPRAYKAAGYTSELSSVPYDILKNPSVRSAINWFLEQKLGPREELALKVLDEIRSVGFSRLDEVVDVDSQGNVMIRPTSEWSDQARSAIKSISQSTTEHGGSMTVHFHSKDKALELLGKHLKLFTEKVELSGGVKVNVNISLPDNGRSAKKVE